MDLTIPIGSHLFTPEALQKAIDATKVEITPEKHGAIVGALDANGVKVGLVFKSVDGKWRAEGAFEHSWDGNDQIGGKVVMTW